MNKEPVDHTLPPTDAITHEHKFPHDYEVQELIERYRDKPHFTEHLEQSLINDHRIRTRGVAGVLADAAERLRATIPSEHHTNINVEFGTVAAALDGNLPDIRWVILDYEVGIVRHDGDKVELEEHTRPHGDICLRYWNEVNS